MLPSTIDFLDQDFVLVRLNFGIPRLAPHLATKIYLHDVVDYPMFVIMDKQYSSNLPKKISIHSYTRKSQVNRRM